MGNHLGNARLRVGDLERQTKIGPEVVTITSYPAVEHGLLEKHGNWEPPGGTGVYRRSLYFWRNFTGRWTPCDLLLFLDGQNLFRTPQKEGLPHWNGEYHFANWHQPLLVVGVPASRRRYPEYIGWSQEPGHYSPSGQKHAEFLAKHLLPYFKGWYPKARLRGLVGASAGGVAALYAGWMFPKTFPAICCLSAGRHYFDELLTIFEGCPSKRLYISCGNSGMDRDFLPQSKYFAAQILKRRPEELLCRWHPGDHSEPVWSKRLQDILEFTLKKPS